MLFDKFSPRSLHLADPMVMAPINDYSALMR